MAYVEQRARVEIESLEYNGVIFNMDDCPWYQYYLFWWCPVDKPRRYWGYAKSWHDGPMSFFGLWFCDIQWRMPWTKHDGGIIR